MKILSDFLALILFFAVYWLSRNIYVATAAAAGAGLFQLALTFVVRKKIDAVQATGTALIVVLGGIAMVFRNPLFIQWKPSILFWLIALVIAGGFLLNKNMLKTLMGKEITLPEHVWRKLAVAWILFFLLMGLINLYVAYSFSEEVWVNYKVFGAMTLLLLFVIAQSLYMARFLSQTEKNP